MPLCNQIKAWQSVARRRRHRHHTVRAALGNLGCWTLAASFAHFATLRRLEERHRGRIKHRHTPTRRDDLVALTTFLLPATRPPPTAWDCRPYQAYHPPDSVSAPAFTNSPTDRQHQVVQPATEPIYLADPPKPPAVAAMTTASHGSEPLKSKIARHLRAVCSQPMEPTTCPTLSNPVHYTRDPHKLVAYLVPFPKRRIHMPSATLSQVPPRFLIYTPLPPPLQKPVEGVKEERIHKIQRKWEAEVRAAKNSSRQNRRLARKHHPQGRSVGRDGPHLSLQHVGHIGRSPS
jgi:hypothetical protein